MAKKVKFVKAAANFEVTAGTRLEDGDRFIAVKDACDLTCLSEPTIRRKLTRGDLRRFKAGGKTLLLYSDVIGLVREVKAQK
jgi:hypothetical protein